MPPREKTRVFISFGYHKDNDPNVMLAGQAKKKDAAFAIEDWFIKEASRGWKSEARRPICRSDIIISGHNAHNAVGVSTGVVIAKDEGKPYYLLAGRKNGGNDDLMERGSARRCTRGPGTTFVP